MLLLMVQICGLPDRPLANAIWDPSGDQVGPLSFAPELVRRLAPGAFLEFPKGRSPGPGLDRTRSSCVRQAH